MGDPASSALEIHERRDAERLAMALKAGRMGTWTYHLATGALEASAIGRDIFGLSEDEGLSLDDINARVHPDDVARRDQALALAIEHHQDLDIEYRLKRSDGGMTWVMLRGRAEYGPDGTAERVVGISLDVTERKENEARLQLLLDELNHRVKNTLAIVQSIAVQTHRTTATPEAFSKALVARVEALARAHDLLTARNWDGALLNEVVDLTLEPYASRVGFSGPAIRLSPNACVTMNMTFHELATNAAKYGALSGEDGRVEVIWSVDDSQIPSTIRIDWIETGGPPVLTPNHSGFGSRLIRQSLVRELPGTVSLNFDLRGLRCEMRLEASAKIAPVEK